MSRRDAREKAFMLLYQLEIQKGELEDQLAVFIETQEIKPGDTDYFSQLVHGVRLNLETIDAIFEPRLKRWTKDRLPKIDLSILRLAVYEMRFVEAVPNNVAISEAVLLTKKYSTEESRSYINAVLGRISQEAVT